MKKSTEVLRYLANSDTFCVLSLARLAEPEQSFYLKKGDVLTLSIEREEIKTIRWGDIAQYASRLIILGPPKLAVAAEQPWNVWFGGECPLPEGVMVEYALRDATRNECEAKNLDWSHTNSFYDIIAFRVAGLAEGYELS